jgi:hypothetical protein
VNLIEPAPEGISIEEEGNSLKITYKYKFSLKSIFISLILISFPCLLIWLIHSLQNKTIPIFFYPIIFIAICANFILTAITSKVIEINNMTISTCQKPLANRTSNKNIPLSNINNIFCEAESFLGLLNIYTLKVLLNNGEKITLVGRYPEEEEKINFIHSVIQKRLGLEGKEIKTNVLSSN